MKTLNKILYKMHVYNILETQDKGNEVRVFKSICKSTYISNITGDLHYICIIKLLIRLQNNFDYLYAQPNRKSMDKMELMYQTSDHLTLKIQHYHTQKTEMQI